MAPVGFSTSVVTVVAMHHTILFSVLITFLGAVHATLLNHKPGLRIASTALRSALKPFNGKPIESPLDKRNINPLAGLLDFQVRSATVCPSGYGECSNNHSKCCPIGGACCSKKCCDSGYLCYSTGSAFRFISDVQLTMWYISNENQLLLSL
jgi:hypothetical protein